MIVESIPRVQSMSRLQFASYLRQPETPLVLTSAMNDWPALGDWSLEFFAEQFPRFPIRAHAPQSAVAQFEVQTFVAPYVAYLRDPARGLAEGVWTKGDPQDLALSHWTLYAGNFNPAHPGVGDPEDEELECQPDDLGGGRRAQRLQECGNFAIGQGGMVNVAVGLLGKTFGHTCNGIFVGSVASGFCPIKYSTDALFDPPSCFRLRQPNRCKHLQDVGRIDLVDLASPDLGKDVLGECVDPLLGVFGISPGCFVLFMNLPCRHLERRHFTASLAAFGQRIAAVTGQFAVGEYPLPSLGQ